MKQNFQCEVCDDTFETEDDCALHESICSLTDEFQIMAVKLHRFGCKNHKTGMVSTPCSWYSEITNGIHNWEGNAHRNWFSYTRVVKPQFDEMSISVEDAIKVFELMSSRR